MAEPFLPGQANAICFWCGREGRKAFMKDKTGVWLCQYADACLKRQAGKWLLLAIEKETET